jgi:drug/metabolite transporter (DMT)-like permease
VSTPVLVNCAALSGLILTVSICQVLLGCRVLSSDIAKISWADWIILIGLAESSLMAFTSMTLALKLISPNLVSSLQTLELVLAYSFQALVTGESPEIWSCLGGGLILFGVLMLTFQDKISEMFSVILVSPFYGLYQTIPAQYGYQRIGD